MSSAWLRTIFKRVRFRPVEPLFWRRDYQVADDASWPSIGAPMPTAPALALPATDGVAAFTNGGQFGVQLTRIDYRVRRVRDELGGFQDAVDLTVGQKREDRQTRSACGDRKPAIELDDVAQRMRRFDVGGEHHLPSRLIVNAKKHCFIAGLDQSMHPGKGDRSQRHSAKDEMSPPQELEPQRISARIRVALHDALGEKRAE